MSDMFDDVLAESVDSAIEGILDEFENPEPIGSHGITVELDSEIHKFTPTDLCFSPGMDVLNTRDALTAAARELEELRLKKATITLKIDELRREFSLKLQVLEDEKAPVEDEINRQRRNLRQAEFAIRNAEQKLRDALRSMLVQREFESNALKFDTITQNFKWRDQAFKHQIEGAKLLATARRAILADKMGLGKTLTSLITCDMLEAQKILVVVPDDVVGNFVREIAHWAEHRTVIQLGKRDKASRDMLFKHVLQAMDEFIVVVNYSAWRKDKSVLDSLVLVRFDTVIMDEAHTIKNIRTSAFKGCEKIVLSDNSCPECRGHIQPVHDTSDHVGTWINNDLIPRDYNLCMGENLPLSKRIEIDGTSVFGQGGCGWSGALDRIKHVKRDAGAMRSVINLIPMTGTVILNKPTDIFALLKLIDPIEYYSEPEFIRNYCETNYAGKLGFRSGGLESLTKQLAGRYVGRDRDTAGVKLPKQDVIIHSIELDKTRYADQAMIIEQLSKHAMIQLSSGEALPIPVIIALITRKRQAVVWPAGIEIKDPETGLVVFSVGDDVDESAKLDMIVQKPERTESGEWEGMVPDFTGNGDMINGERVVVFSQFKTPLAELQKRITAAGISCIRMDGSTPEHIREQIKIDFDRKHCDQPGYEKKWQVVLCNYKTGGVGLNFSSATQTIILDEEWNPGKRDQAYGRTDRIGQTEESNVHVLRMENTIDDWMAALMSEKEDMADGFKSNIDLASSLLDAMREGRA